MADGAGLEARVGALASAREGTGVPAPGGGPGWERALHVSSSRCRVSGYGLVYRWGQVGGPAGWDLE